MIPIVKYHRLPNMVDEFLRNDYWGGKEEKPHFRPSVNIVEADDKYVFEFALPGYEKDELKVSLDKNILSISFEGDKSTPNDVRYLKKEFHKANFKRSFELPQNAKLENIEASHNNGILTISVLKAAKVEIPVADIEVK
jgi:HSP20 family protein